MKEKLRNYFSKFDLFQNSKINPVMLRLYIAGCCGNYRDFKEAAEYEKTASLNK